MGFPVQLTQPEHHPLRQKATECRECSARAVFFNPYNVDVTCHACGTREFKYECRLYHFFVYLEARFGEATRSEKEGEDG